MKLFSRNTRLGGLLLGLALVVALVGAPFDRPGQSVSAGLNPGLPASGPGEGIATPRGELASAPAPDGEPTAGQDRREANAPASLTGRLVGWSGPIARLEARLVNKDWGQLGWITDFQGVKAERRGKRTKQRISALAYAAGGADFLFIEPQGMEDDGNFLFSQLEPGEYSLVIRSGLFDAGSGHEFGVPTVNLVQLAVSLAAGEDQDIGDLKVSDAAQENLLRQQAAWERQSRRPVVLVHSDASGLKVLVHARGNPVAIKSRMTDSHGDARIVLSPREAVRIDITNSAGDVLGSTDRYLTYASGRETRVELPGTAARLVIHLPPNGKVRRGETFQVFVTRAGGSGLDLKVKSILGSRLNQKRPGILTTATSIEFTNLRPGFYTIKGIRKIVQANGSRPHPTGGWLFSTAEVYPGALSQCELQ